MFENLLSQIFYLTKYSNIIGELDKQFKLTFNFKSPTKLGENLQNPISLNSEDFEIWSDKINGRKIFIAEKLINIIVI